MPKGVGLFLCPFSHPSVVPIFAFMKSITLPEALKIIESGTLFSVKVISFDRKRTAQNGRILEYRQVRKESAHQKAIGAKKEKMNRIPQHFEHFTRNVRIYADGIPSSSIVKIHPLLISEIN